MVRTRLYQRFGGDVDVCCAHPRRMRVSAFLQFSLSAGRGTWFPQWTPREVISGKEIMDFWERNNWEEPVGFFCLLLLLF